MNDFLDETIAVFNEHLGGNVVMDHHRDEMIRLISDLADPPDPTEIPDSSDNITLNLYILYLLRLKEPKGPNESEKLKYVLDKCERPCVLIKELLATLID